MITYGIVTHGLDKKTLWECKKSIWKNMSLGDDLVVVYDNAAFRMRIDEDHIEEFEVDFTARPGMICHKKNFIARVAANDILAISHDYISYGDGWRDGLVKFDKENPDWEISMNKIENTDGFRYRDWCKFFSSKKGYPWTQFESSWQKEPVTYAGSPHLLSYDDPDADFISGAYWVCKRHVMLEEPLNENLVWGNAEDCEWSLRVIPKYKYKFNKFSTVQLLTPHDVVFQEANNQEDAGK
jgi:hypothetical protein